MVISKYDKKWTEENCSICKPFFELSQLKIDLDDAASLFVKKLICKK